jgi:hypothetical protein
VAVGQGTSPLQGVNRRDSLVLLHPIKEIVQATLRILSKQFVYSQNIAEKRASLTV